MTARGRFLVVEGIDGCGKSTQAVRLAARFDAVHTLEPGGTALGRSLRHLVLGDGDAPTPMAEALLIAADRAQHVASVIEPALARGQDVVSDRHAASTIAYQGYGRGLPLDELEILISLATGGLQPDLTILLDVDPSVAAARRVGRADRMEREHDRFHHRVRDGYLAQAAADPASWVLIDANGSLAEVDAAVDAAIEPFVERWGR